MTSEALVVRATEDDVYDIARRRWRDTHSRRLYAALDALAPNGTWVAKDDGTIVGVALAHALEREWYLSDLFVEPSFRSAGLGRRLLAEVARDAGDVVRSGLLDPQEREGLALFTRRGISLCVPVLQIAGRIPREDELASMVSGEQRFRAEELDLRRDRDGLAELDRRTRGSSRENDHAYFVAQARGSAFFVHDEFVGYAYAWPDGRIGPLAAWSPSYVAAFFAFAMVVLVRHYSASWCTALVPGTNYRVARAATQSGLSIEALKIFASDADRIDLSCYVGYHELLF